MNVHGSEVDPNSGESSLTSCGLRGVLFSITGEFAPLKVSRLLEDLLEMRLGYVQ